MFVNKKELAIKKYLFKEYPSFIQDFIDSDKFKKPESKEDIKKFWGGINRLIKQYAYRLVNRYKVDYEDLVQESFIFVVELLKKYKPAFHCDYIYQTPCNSKCPFWKSCKKQEFFGWQIYELKPYLFYNIRLKMLDYCQKVQRKNKKYYDLDFISEENSSASDLLISNLSEKKSMSGFVERKILSEYIDKVLDEILLNIKSTKKEVGILYFKKLFTEKQIHKILNKSQSTINTHISSLKKDIRSHPMILTLLRNFSEYGVTIDDIFNE